MVKAERWRMFELEFHSAENYQNPFQDVDVIATFSGPEGQSLSRLAFWDGGHTWRLRGVLTAVGLWHYPIQASDGNSDFTQSGAVECTPYDGNLDIYRHGFIRVGAQGRYLMYDDGTPFFWLGDTHWTFVTEERWDESNCPEYDSQFRACVDKRVQQRFTVYQSNFRDGKEFNLFGKYDEYLLETAHGLLPNIPFLQSNPDSKMQYIADAGLVHAVGYSWGPAILRPGGEERYCLLAKYLSARYGAYPVIWTLAGELGGYLTDGMTGLAQKWQHVAQVTAKWNDGLTLQSVHFAATRPFPDVYQNEPWFHFGMSQAAHGDMDLSPRWYVDYRSKYPRRPLVESEGLYEGALSNERYHRTITDSMMRELAWTAIQNGCCGYTYGCNGVWELQWESGVGGIGWGDMSWWEGLALPGADQLTIMRNFYEQLAWWKLKPIQYLVDQRSFMEREAYFTADDDMSTIVGYFTSVADRNFTLHGLPYSSYKAQWFNPVNGMYTLISDNIRPEMGSWKVQDTRTFSSFVEMVKARERFDKVLLLTANQ